MPCHHTSFEFADGVLVCRTCRMTSTDVYYSGTTGTRTMSVANGTASFGTDYVPPEQLATMVALHDQTLRSYSNAVFGTKYMRPESAVRMANVYPQGLGPKVPEPKP